MDHMSPEPQHTEESVVAFGAADPEHVPGPRRNVGAFLRELGRDRRMVPLLAGLGAVAAFASLISEWQVTALDGIALAGAYRDGEVGDEKLFPADLMDLGGLGAGYLVGLSGLVVAVTLALFGPAAGRRYARLAGLALGGTLLALLLAMVSLLGDQSRLISRLYVLDLENDHMRVMYGRGLWCALAAVAAALGALWLAGRDLESEDGFRWRPPTGDRQDDPEPDDPMDLTITATTPFAPGADNPYSRP